MLTGILVGLVSLFALVALSLLILHKTRKIHLATYQLLAAARETQTLFSQIQSLLALERQLDLDKPLPPLRGWAGSPDFLLRLSNEILDRKPQVVMECSSGVSTVVIARSLQLNGQGRAYSLEHELEFVKKTRKLLEAHGLSNWAQIIHAPLETENTGTPWYAERDIPGDLPPIDLLVVDGPPATTATLARYPALPRLADRLNEYAVIIADDTNRKDETEMIRRWLESFPAAQATNCHCEKGCMLIELNHAVGEESWHRARPLGG